MEGETGVEGWRKEVFGGTEEVLEMTIDLRNLRAEIDKRNNQIEERNQEIEHLKTNMARKDSTIKELQSQLMMEKMEAQVKQKQLIKWKEVMTEANK